MVVILDLNKINANSCRNIEAHMHVPTGCRPFAAEAEEKEKNNVA